MAPGVIFKYTLVPLVDTIQATPAIPFSCFDPIRGSYVDLSIPSLPVTVQAGNFQPDEMSTLMLSENNSESESKSGLSGLATSPGLAFGGLVPLQMRGWFPLVQILPRPRILPVDCTPVLGIRRQSRLSLPRNSIHGNRPTPLLGTINMGRERPVAACVANGVCSNRPPRAATRTGSCVARSTPCKLLVRRIILRLHRRWSVATFYEFSVRRSARERLVKLCGAFLPPPMPPRLPKPGKTNQNFSPRNLPYGKPC